MEKETGETVVQDDKKKRTKKIISVIVFVLAIMLSMCPALFGIYSCAPHVSGDFIFEFNYGYGGGSKVCITGISKKGQKKEVLIIPKKIRGKEVAGLFKRTITIWDNPAIELESKNLKVLYAFKNFKSEALLIGCPNLNKIFILNATKSKEFSNQGLVSKMDGICNYVYSEIYFSKQNEEEVYPANVTYCYNFEGAENYGCYWLDNLEDGEKITYIPAAPTREGYKFAGWYHEPECENEWNFETDTVRASGEESYKDEASFIENRLYAKWLKE